MIPTCWAKERDRNSGAKEEIIILPELAFHDSCLVNSSSPSYWLCNVFSGEQNKNLLRTVLVALSPHCASFTVRGKIAGSYFSSYFPHIPVLPLRGRCLPGNETDKLAAANYDKWCFLCERVECVVLYSFYKSMPISKNPLLLWMLPSLSLSCKPPGNPYLRYCVDSHANSLPEVCFVSHKPLQNSINCYWVIYLLSQTPRLLSSDSFILSHSVLK